MTRGSGKNKGNLPFKCFNCGKISWFASKCPYAKSEDKSEEKGNNKRKEKGKKFQNGDKTRNKKKSFYSKEDSSYDEEDSDFDIDSESDTLLFMAPDNQNEYLELEEEGFEYEGEVNLQGELINALNELKKIRKMYT